MNVLDYLTKKKNNLVPHTHPFAQSTESFKFNYCFGLSVLVYGYKDQMPPTLDCFSSILNRMQLDEQMQKKLPLYVKNNFDLKINDVFRTIDTKDAQYCFIADLYRLSFFGLISPTYSHDIIEGYTQVFNFSQSEKIFFKQFTELAYQTLNELKKDTLSYYDTKLESATQLYQNFKTSGYEISSTILEYIYPGFTISTEIKDLVLNDGSVHRYGSQLHIAGNIVISNCSTLIIEHAKVLVEGSILVENGKIIIKSSDILVKQANTKHFITVNKSPAIIIEDSHIDCNKQCAFLCQDSGHLKLQNVTLKNTVNDYGITFSGSSTDIASSSFEHCEAGAILNQAQKELFVGASTFSDCNSIQGGAILSLSLSDATIYNCKFKNCQARYLGSAIYFDHLKYGQNVLKCSFENCTPEENSVFNAYSP